MTLSDHIVYNPSDNLRMQLQVETIGKITNQSRVTTVTKYKKLKVGDLLFNISLKEISLHKTVSYGSCGPASVQKSIIKKVYSVETYKTFGTEGMHYQVHSLGELFEIVLKVYISKRREK